MSPNRKMADQQCVALFCDVNSHCGVDPMKVVFFMEKKCAKDVSKNKNKRVKSKIFILPLSLTHSTITQLHEAVEVVL
jgi:hypothetical protein